MTTSPSQPDPTHALSSATLDALRRRAELLEAIRGYFRGQGYWEVETPLLGRESVVDAHLDPFVTQDSDGSRYYLQTSPEFGMKRLLAAGAEAIFQITRAFRRGERGTLHNPEFTMLEWYRVGDSHIEQMAFTEALVRHVAERFHAPLDFGDQPFERIRYDEAFARWAGTPVLRLTGGELRELAAGLKIRPPAGLPDEDRDGWWNLLLNAVVEPKLGTGHPVFLYDYPASQAALAKVRPGDPPVAERFELYVRGIELCNGYHELTDAAELESRTVIQTSIRRELGLAGLPSPDRLQAAMDLGLPACAGVAMGVDRLAMLVSGGRSLSDVMAFPIDRA
ncbi:MAG: EF-P lysine aminoacylase EpmA [Planctomycetaceae bacterium]